RLENILDPTTTGAGHPVNRIAIEFRGCGGNASVGGSVVFQENTNPSTGVKMTSGGAGTGQLCGIPNYFAGVGPYVVDINQASIDCVVAPQLDDRQFASGAGEMSIPKTPTNGGLWAFPYVRRINRTPGTTDTLSGLIIPSGSATPSGSGAVNGT